MRVPGLTVLLLGVVDAGYVAGEAAALASAAPKGSAAAARGGARAGAARGACEARAPRPNLRLPKGGLEPGF